ncbi:MAG: transglycosylase SLT domain-containing protein [Parvularculaceae bacterium]
MTDAITSAATASAAVSGALKKASAETGVGFDYLYRVALRESSLNPAAKASTSTAAGLFQFIEQTWLGAVKKYGGQYGLAAEAAAITETASGKFIVADAQQRQAILDLRFDPGKAAALAGALARENKAALESSLGREVAAGELYAAHFLGATGARILLTAKATDKAATLLPAAAAANTHVFYDGARARSVSEVIDSFTKTIGGAKAAIADIGAAIEKSLAPALREGARSLSFERASSRGPFEVKSLSPLALAVLQALDPREIRRDDDRR